MSPCLVFEMRVLCTQVPSTSSDLECHGFDSILLPGDSSRDTTHLSRSLFNPEGTASIIA